MDSSIRQTVLVILLIALTASLLEGVVLTVMRRHYDWRATASSLFITVGRRVVEITPLAFALPGGAWLYEHRLFQFDMARWWSWALLFLGLEFFYYWYHRSAHRVRWFWASHSVHHSPNQFNFSAAYRLSWTSRITLALVFFLPLAWIGFSPRVIIAAYGINLLYQFWIHAEWIPKLGWLEGVLNTPSAHRVHHAANLNYLDSNYGGILMVFDRLFGTYTAERDDLVIRYGLVEPLLSHNPFKILFSPWLSLIKDVRQARSFGERIQYLFRPPGWTPGGDGKTTAHLQARAQPPT
jgi:sterol desaturase/sphingolipid hydroxylase (fatty acid hydroxylase superfamily)